MYENLKSDKVIAQFGGRFKLASAIQRRWLELMQGARPLVAKPGQTHLETAVQELLDGRIEMYVPEKSTLEPPPSLSSSTGDAEDE
jgi:DNA-directed RNA polymerase subunit omega